MTRRSCRTKGDTIKKLFFLLLLCVTPFARAETIGRSNWDAQCNLVYLGLGQRIATSVCHNIKSIELIFRAKKSVT